MQILSSMRRWLSITLNERYQTTKHTKDNMLSESDSHESRKYNSQTTEAEPHNMRQTKQVHIIIIQTCQIISDPTQSSRPKNKKSIDK